MSRFGRFLGAALAMLASATILAQPAGGPFVLRKSVIAGGSSMAESQPFRVQATVGQAETGSMAGENFRVEGGFWPSDDTQQPQVDPIFGDGFES